MNWREVSASDIADCLNLEPQVCGDEIVGRERALCIWKEWTRSLSFNSCLIELAIGPSAKQNVAFGASIFVAPDFATCELARPRPGLNSRILAGVASGSPAVLPEARLCDGKALDAVILACCYLYEAMNPEQTIQAEMTLPIAFAEMHVGYHLHRIFIETVTARQRQVHESSGVWRPVAEFPERGRALLVLTAKEALSVSGSLAAPLFHYSEPIFHLRNSEKELLSQAMNGETDAELAAKLNLSLPAVKKRWSSVFDKIAGIRPDLLPDAFREPQESRGSQKRHHILAYLRSHPEELRPYRWRSDMNS